MKTTVFKILRFVMFNAYMKRVLYKKDGPFYDFGNRRLRAMVKDFGYYMSLMIWFFFSIALFLCIRFTTILFTSENPYGSSMIARITNFFVELIAYAGNVNLLKSPGFQLAWDIFFMLISILLINKDFFNSQSVANRVEGYQVYAFKANEPANELRCMIRNLTAFIWPIEVLFASVNPGRRLGDYLAGTILIEVEKSDPELIITDMKAKRLDRTSILALLLPVLMYAAAVLILNMTISK
jgi:hypothetical protein